MNHLFVMLFALFFVFACGDETAPKSPPAKTQTQALSDSDTFGPDDNQDEERDEDEKQDDEDDDDEEEDDDESEDDSDDTPLVLDDDPFAFGDCNGLLTKENVQQIVHMSGAEDQAADLGKMTGWEQAFNSPILSSAAGILGCYNN